jgi:hypothetical protein
MDNELKLQQGEVIPAKETGIPPSFPTAETPEDEVKRVGSSEERFPLTPDSIVMPSESESLRGDGVSSVEADPLFPEVSQEPLDAPGEGEPFVFTKGEDGSERLQGNYIGIRFDVTREASGAYVGRSQSSDRDGNVIYVPIAKHDAEVYFRAYQESIAPSSSHDRPTFNPNFD